MSRTEAEWYLNYAGHLRVGLRLRGPLGGYDRIMDRAEAIALRDQLNAALNIADAPPECDDDYPPDTERTARADWQYDADKDDRLTGDI